MLDIVLVAFGAIKNKNYQAAANEYLKRLSPYARIKVVEISPVSFSRSNHLSAQKQETKKLQEILAKYSQHQIIILDENGQSLDSLTFAQKLAKINSPLLLVIGAPLGFSPEIKAAYPSWSLSPLTMPHELARVVLLEQLYRVTTIINNKEYHY